MLSRPPIERTREGDVLVRLSGEERELLRALPGQLRSLLDDEPGDPSLRRLFPPAYDDEGEAEAEADYRRLLHGDLAAGRREALGVLERTAGRERLDEGELEAWLAALNDLRLVLGTRLEVSEEVYERDLDPGHPQAYELAVYAYLSWLQEHAVAAAAARRG